MNSETSKQTRAFLEKLINQIEENGLMQYDCIHNGNNWVLEEAQELLDRVKSEDLDNGEL